MAGRVIKPAWFAIPKAHSNAYTKRSGLMERPCFHLSIPAHELGVSAAWYERVLACPAGRRSSQAAIFDLGGHQLVLQQHCGTPDPRQPGIYPRHFGLVFDSLLSWEALRDRMVELGEPFRVEPKWRYPGEPLEHLTFFLVDPSDNWLEFKHYTHADAVLGCQQLAAVGDRDLRASSPDGPAPFPARAGDGSAVKLPEPGWIGAVLGATITALDAQLLGETRGFQSTTWQLSLRSDPPLSAPASVILKSEASDGERNTFSRLHNAFAREVGVYNHFAPRLQAHRPSIYGCQAAQPSWVLMEDLSHLRSGDQVVGLSYQESAATIEAMAAIHAEFWMDPALEQHSWLPEGSFWYAEPKTEILDDFLAVYGVRFGPEVCRLHAAVLEQTSAINQALRDRPWTLVHGDLRADNLLFDNTAEDPAAVILDWSWATRSLAAIDLAFLVGGSTPPVQRLGRHDDLLLAWHRALLHRGVRDYTLADARRDQQLAALRCLTAGIAIHAFSKGDQTPVRIALYMDDAIQRHAAYAAEVAAWEALPDPTGFPTA
jgi:hypothetical protein